MIKWSNFTSKLGCLREDLFFSSLTVELGEEPTIENDMLGVRTYYSFSGSGILCLFENEVFEQVSFFIQPHGNFSAYKGGLPEYLIKSNEEDSIVKSMGSPSSSGGGKEDMLIGYINRWIKYVNEGYSLHMEFNKNKVLRKITFMINE